ncbi:MAG: histidine phosphatase family protein [Candidatus Moraniibacteriota bacterium]|nr:MAG: histidine phosphatase family protein [Candidatus Moranbacteria bacterium]
MEGGSFKSMEGGPERGPESKEQEPKQITRVILELMRHGKRERGKTVEEEANPNLRLTPEGRAQVTEHGKTVDPQPEVAMGMGSSRVRTQETAYRVMLANEDISPDDSLEVIEAKVAEQVHYGKKMLVDDRLGFTDEGPIGPDGVKAYMEKRYLPWAMNDSDRDAIEKGDEKSSTYTRMAGNVAEIVARYATVGNNFQRIVARDTEGKYEETGNQLERYLGTHMGIAECFTAKVLETVKGVEAKDKFVQSIGSGFLEAEGVRIEIVNTGMDQTIVLTYTIKDAEQGDRKESVQFGREVLAKIIDDRKAFETLVTTANQQE